MRAESQVAETFADRPLAEASVREMLGLAYLNLGDAAQAVKQYERALALREAMQGVNHPDTAACRNQLAVAYRLAGRTAEAGRLFDRNPNSPAHASALAVRGSMLLLQKKPAEAELKLRECLTIRQKIQPDDWTTFDTKSMLGEALLDQKKFADAEPLLLSGYEGMKQREDTIPSQDKPRLTKALERLVRLYEAWGKNGQGDAVAEGTGGGGGHEEILTGIWTATGLTRRAVAKHQAPGSSRSRHRGPSPEIPLARQNHYHPDHRLLADKSLIRPCRNGRH